MRKQAGLQIDPATIKGQAAGDLVLDLKLGKTAKPDDRNTSAAVDPVPNGPSPVAANVSTAPRLKTSLGGPTVLPTACSGDMNPGSP